jgi:hypothetical protein
MDRLCPPIRSNRNRSLVAEESQDHTTLHPTMQPESPIPDSPCGAVLPTYPRFPGCVSPFLSCPRYLALQGILLSRVKRLRWNSNRLAGSQQTKSLIEPLREGVTDGTFTQPVWKFARPRVLTGNVWVNVPSVTLFVVTLFCHAFYGLCDRSSELRVRRAVTPFAAS